MSGRGNASEAPMDEVSDQAANRRARGLDRAFEILQFLQLR